VVFHNQPAHAPNPIIDDVQVVAALVHTNVLTNEGFGCKALNIGQGQPYLLAKLRK
jgi:hypothetical protein